MNDTDEKQATPDFMRLWQESLERMVQAAGTFSPESMPPEILRQIRGGFFQALARSWEEFLRSPQFLDSMKQMMDTSIAFRQMSADFLTKTRQELQGTSQQDVQDVLLALREMEARLTRRVDELAGRVARQERHREAGSSQPTRAKVGAKAKGSGRPKKRVRKRR